MVSHNEISTFMASGASPLPAFRRTSTGTATAAVALPPDSRGGSHSCCSTDAEGLAQVSDHDAAKISDVVGTLVGVIWSDGGSWGSTAERRW
jgi:hypothetical protein